MLQVPRLNLPEVCRRIEEFIRESIVQADANGAVVGLSGGLDSSTTAYLCKRALGSEKVIGLILPDEQVTPKEDIEDAKLVANELGIDYEVIEISRICDSFISACPGKSDRVSEGNVKVRVRMVFLYQMANRLKRLVVGTSDRSEYLIGYFTKYGDGAADILPLGGLFKTQVRELASYLGLPESIVKKPSSPRLWIGHIAEAELGIGYDLIDPILYGLLDLKMKAEDVAKELDVPLERVSLVEEMIKRSAHKRQMPRIPVLE